MLATAFLSIGAGAEVAQGGFGRLWATLKPLFDAFASIAGRILGALEPVLAVAAELLEGLVGAVVRAGPAFAEVFGRLGEFVGRLAQALEPLVPVIVGVFEDWLDAVLELLPPFAELAGAVADALVPALQLAVGVWAVFQESINQTIGLVTTLARVLNKFLIPQFEFWAWLLGKLTKGMGELFGIDMDKQASFKMDTKVTPGRGPAAPRPGGMEHISALWDRVAAASRLVGGAKDPQQEANGLLEKILDKQQDTVDAVKDIKPAITH
jgi:hypothetical protein